MTNREIGDITTLRGDLTQMSDYTDWTAHDWNLTDEQRKQLAEQTLHLVTQDYNDRLVEYGAWLAYNGVLYQWHGSRPLPQPGSVEHRDLLQSIDEAVLLSMRVLYARAEVMESRN